MFATHSSTDLSVILSFVPSVHCSMHLFIDSIVSPFFQAVSVVELVRNLAVSKHLRQCICYMLAAHSSTDLSTYLSFASSVHCSMHLFIDSIVRTCQRTWGWTGTYAFDCGPAAEDRWMGRTFERMRGLGPEI